MFVSLAVIGLFACVYFLPTSVVARIFSVDLVTAVVALITFIVSFALYIKSPQKATPGLTFISYALLVATIASTVLVTGQSDSPLIGLWIAAGVFAGVFGWRGYTLMLLLIAGYDGYSYVTDPSKLDSIIVATVASVAPLIASFIIWHNKSTKEARHDKAYRELATELSHESNKSETVIGSINDGVLSVDKQGVIQLFNPAAGRIIGWGKEDAVGLSYKSVLKLNNKADKPIDPTEDPVAKVLASNQEVRTEDFSISTEAGKKILLSVVVSPIGTPSTGAIVVFRDITKEKAEEREQAEFISTASHEMRTPVASIEGYLGLALNPATATIDEKARDYIQKAHESAQHLGRLFQDLLDVSKSEDGRMLNNPSVLDMIDYVGTVVEGLKPKADEKGLRFLYKPSTEAESTVRNVAPVYYTHVDNDHLREVVSNLVENAIKYTPAGDVIVDVTGDDTHVSVSVQDSGIGIPTEDIPHLFQKFYRVDNTDTREIGGTGLGLYLSRRLAEMMGGTINVASEYKKVSTFTVVLPRIDHLEAQRLMEASTAAAELASAPIEATAAAKEAPFVPEPPQPEAQAQPAAYAQQAPQPTTFAPAAVPQPVAQSIPQVQPAPMQVQPPAPQPAAPIQPRQSVPVTPQAPNIPLSQLEQNPGAYVAARPPVQIPVRSPNESPKT
ncbi:MAG: ATP-binding protein [Candidatus Saccharimonadales bacterium]